MLHWRRIKVYARSVWDVIIIITAFCLANDGHLLFSAQWLQKSLGGAGGRCWQEAGWFTGPPPPSAPPSFIQLALHICTLLSASTSFHPRFLFHLFSPQTVYPISSYFILFNFLIHLSYHLCCLLSLVKGSFAVKGSCCPSAETQWGEPCLKILKLTPKSKSYIHWCCLFCTFINICDQHLDISNNDAANSYNKMSTHWGDTYTFYAPNQHCFLWCPALYFVSCYYFLKYQCRFQDAVMNLCRVTDREAQT